MVGCGFGVASIFVAFLIRRSDYNKRLIYSKQTKGKSEAVSSTIAEEVRIDLCGRVRNSTNEDWENIQLRLVANSLLLQQDSAKLFKSSSTVSAPSTGYGCSELLGEYDGLRQLQRWWYADFC